jgi:hypothetical protein
MPRLVSDAPVPVARFYSPDGRYVHTQNGWEKVTRETWPPMSPDSKFFWDGAAWRPWGPPQRRVSTGFVIAILVVVIGLVAVVAAEMGRADQFGRELDSAVCAEFSACD